MTTADKAKKMVDVLGESLDFLMSEAAKEDSVDKDMVQRMQHLQQLPDTEKDKIRSVIDALIRDLKTRKAYAY